jgi:A/G-specific adenine glycosylase
MSMERSKSGMESPAWRRALQRKLLAWFRRAARDLPWRRTRDLYAIWISEIMLQQTQVATVIPYWQRFLACFPDARSLAAADEQEVLRLWEGLGYYRRARQLHAAARHVVARHDGQFPTDLESVLALPGIGRYTAGAILSIGLDQRLPILEANTIRVLSRLIAFEEDPASAAGQRALWSSAEAILPARQCGALNQALMELGSEICTPQAPACGRCPVAALCQARQRNLVGRIPKRPNPTRYEDVTEIAVVIRDRGRVLLRHCQRGERWAGLWDFPRFAATGASSHQEQIAARSCELIGLQVAPGQRLATLKHGVTRFRITLHCYEAVRRSPTSHIAATARWIALRDLNEYPLSTTGRRIGQLVAQLCQR